MQSPSQPSKSYKPRVGVKFHISRFIPDERSFKQRYKPGFGNQKSHHFTHRTYFPKRDFFQHKKPQLPPREWKRKQYEAKESTDSVSPPKQNSTARPFQSSSASSRDEDKHFTPPQYDRNPSRERDDKKIKSKDKEPNRGREVALTASQMAARDRAIQQKRKEIDEVYYRECATFGLVVKMLIEKDPSLDRPIQSSLQKNLRDIGTRCVKAMEKFIEDYDSGETTH
ncbi:periphilin-1 isoform X2 [Thalassophryne amazonica]|nr:periphilin-1 isoform X2 [Thalassophryne amazonica]XP_034028596.1 periphilin-1 isoform X2 [Thalassophryne amazonica]